MKKKTDIPVTSAIRFLRDNNIAFEPHFYKYEEHGGTPVAAKALGADEHCVIKTIVFLTDEKSPLFVLMHGDCEVSAKNLARFISAKNVQPSDERTAERLTGYVFGGMTPLGSRTRIPVYVEWSIFGLNQIYLNAGKRGFLVKIRPEDLDILNPVKVEVGIPHMPAG
jgi:Cys-tRNA(Pro) deacylase